MEDHIKLAVVGINHNTSTVEEREKFQIGRKEVPLALNEIFEYEEIEGLIILSTCNRMELYMTMINGASPFDIIRRYYQTRNKIDIASKSSLFYSFKGLEIPHHLFRVISGLESMVLGEYQIQGQVKEAYSVACQQKTVDSLLHKLFHAAFRSGKRVRTNTCLGDCKQSVSGAASEIMIENTNKEDTIAIIGVNENTKIMANALFTAGYRNLIFVNRTKLKAEILANDFGGKTKSWKNIIDALEESDAVYTCTGSPDYIISRKNLLDLRRRDKCPKLLIDMAVPRDIDTEGCPEYIKTYNISDLKNYLKKQQEAAFLDIPEAEKIINNDVELFRAWSESRHNEVLGPYAEKFEEIRQQVFEEFIDQFSASNHEKIDKLTKSITHRMQSTFVRILIKQKQEEMLNSVNK